MNKDTILSIKDLRVSFKSEGKTVTPISGVSLDVIAGKTLGLVGESGCGKSVTAHSIMHLLPRTGFISGGTVDFRFKDGHEETISAFKRTGKKTYALRGGEIGMIFQDPMMSLNPVYNLGDQITEGVRYREKISRNAAYDRAAELMELLGIPRAKERLRDYPHQFSGGMKQRVMIAMALISNPSLLIADEPTTALDVTVQAQILELLQEIQRKFGTTIILITHNMGIVADMADHMAVMYMGRVVEYGDADDVFNNPKHPYTKALLSSVPVLGIGVKKRLEPIRGNTPDINDLPPGCEFMPRCDCAIKRCETERPDETALPNGRRVRCFLAEGEGIQA